MHAAIAATLLTLAPTPGEIHAAEADLHAPDEAPAFLSPSPRSRRSYLTVLTRLGAVDPGVEPWWFASAETWDRDVFAGRCWVAEVAGAPWPHEGSWLPTPADCVRIAEASRADVGRLRERLAWEPDRVEPLARAIADAETVAATYDGLWAVLMEHEDGGPVGCGRPVPRRYVLAGLRAALGERWERREWPEQAAWWALSPR